MLAHEAHQLAMSQPASFYTLAEQSGLSILCQIFTSFLRSRDVTVLYNESNIGFESQPVKLFYLSTGSTLKLYQNMHNQCVRTLQQEKFV